LSTTQLDGGKKELFFEDLSSMGKSVPWRKKKGKHIDRYTGKTHLLYPRRALILRISRE
jgi:hypothetical protein